MSGQPSVLVSTPEDAATDHCVVTSVRASVRLQPATAVVPAVPLAPPFVSKRERVDDEDPLRATLGSRVEFHKNAKRLSSAIRFNGATLLSSAILSRSARIHQSEKKKGRCGAARPKAHERTLSDGDGAHSSGSTSHCVDTQNQHQAS